MLQTLENPVLIVGEFGKKVCLQERNTRGWVISTEVHENCSSAEQESQTMGGRALSSHSFHLCERYSSSPFLSVPVWQLGEPPEMFQYSWCLIVFTDKGETVFIFLLYLQAKPAGVFQSWTIFLSCFSWCLFLRQLPSPKWICAIHHSLAEMGEQFHYSFASFLYSTVEMSKGFFWTCLVLKQNGSQE